jgi:hypothetical protein
MVTMLLLLVRAVMVTLSLLWMVPLAWMLRRESVWFKPIAVPAKGVKVLVSRRATSKASLAVLVVSPVTKWLSLIVNWRVFAPVGMMKAWVSSESFWDCSVRVAVPLMMLVAPAVFQVVAVVKSPLQYSGHFFQQFYKAFRACLSRIKLFFQGELLPLTLN